MATSIMSVQSNIRVAVGTRCASTAGRPHAAIAARPFLSGGASLAAPCCASRPISAHRSTVKVNSLFKTTEKSSTKSPDSPFYNITVEDIDGKKLTMNKFAGKVVLVTNVASECGFTKQYKGLSELYNKYQKDGFVVLGAPCNQFGGQEPGSNKEIKSFAAKQGAKFPLTSKLDVNGPDTSELYKYLKSQQGGLFNKDVKWNFSKFLVDREGNVVKRYFSTAEPADIEKDIVALL
mmetsp:Transcript_20036/g.55657  ORF Transcript_20036/g.55657 Transcript_20036/m.55657 type:complete len:235 (+) Transcript_20036:128-832(+)